jgi:hypothetical protein
MSVLELSVSIAIWVVALAAVGRVITRAGFSAWWVVLPAAVPVVTYVTLAQVHAHTRVGALSYNALVHSHRALVIADAACAALVLVMLVVFALVDWPALRAVPAAAPATAGSVTRARSGSSRSSHPAASSAGSLPPARRIRALPDVSGEPAGWYASGALGSGEQSYWDGAAWTARRVWRFETWIDLPMDDASERLVASR